MLLIKVVPDVLQGGASAHHLIVAWRSNGHKGATSDPTRPGRVLVGGYANGGRGLRTTFTAGGRNGDKGPFNALARISNTSKDVVKHSGAPSTEP